MLLRQRDAFVVDQRGMLDRAHARAYRALDALGAMRMRSDEGAALRGFLHRGMDLGFGVFGFPGFGASGQHRAGGDDLDQVGAAIEHDVDMPAHVIHALGDAAAECFRHHGALRQAGDLAAAAGHGDVGAGDEHARSGHVAGVDRIAQRDIGEAAIDAHIAHGGEAGAHGVARVFRADEGVACRVALQRRAGVGHLAFVGEMGVHVHQARHHRIGRPVEHVRARGGRRPRRDRDDAAVLDRHRLVGEHAAAVDVEQVAGAHHGPLRALGVGDLCGCQRRKGEQQAVQLHGHADSPASWA